MAKIEECPFKTNDILVCVWGYGQTNVNFFKVKRTTEKSIWLVRIESCGVTENGQKKKYKYLDGEGYCMPDPQKELAEAGIFDPLGPKRLQYDMHKEPYVKVLSHVNAYRWQGKPLRESWYY